MRSFKKKVTLTQMKNYKKYFLKAFFFRSLVIGKDHEVVVEIFLNWNLVNGREKKLGNYFLWLRKLTSLTVASNLNNYRRGPRIFIPSRGTVTLLSANWLTELRKQKTVPFFLRNLLAVLFVRKIRNSDERIYDRPSWNNYGCGVVFQHNDTFIFPEEFYNMYLLPSEGQ